MASTKRRTKLTSTPRLPLQRVPARHSCVCDGCRWVLTDAGMYYSESGDEWKKFNTRDGMGIKLLQRQG